MLMIRPSKDTVSELLFFGRSAPAWVLKERETSARQSRRADEEHHRHGWKPGRPVSEGMHEDEHGTDQ
jgi:hypothetical protein